VRKPATVLMGLLVAMLLIGAVAAVAATITPNYVSASVSPRHKNQAPYTFTTSGAIHYRRCPHGVTKHNYCVSLPPGQTCTGTMGVDVKLGPDPLLVDQNKTIMSASGKVSSKCTYSITTTIPKSELTGTSRYRPHERGSYVYVSFSVKFGGNRVLRAKGARQQNVVAKLRQP
jgi:hypothetical protein